MEKHLSEKKKKTDGKILNSGTLMENWSTRSRRLLATPRTGFTNWMKPQVGFITPPTARKTRTTFNYIVAASMARKTGG